MESYYIKNKEDVFNVREIFLEHPKYGGSVWIKSICKCDKVCVILGIPIVKGSHYFKPIKLCPNWQDGISTKGMQKLVTKMKRQQYYVKEKKLAMEA